MKINYTIAGNTMQENDNRIQQEHKPSKSKLTRKSIGHAASNLPLDSNMLEVYAVEDVGYADGEINAERETIETSGVDDSGNVYSDVIETSNTILAEWLPWGSNRYTAPNVRRGEKVILWQYAEVDKYYWTIMGTEDYLRRLETVIFNFSNTRDESTEKLDHTNSYSFIVSTHTKEITVQTCKSDGEKFEYVAKIDAAKGIFVISDDIGNQVSIESGEKRVSLTNASGSSVVLDKKNIDITAPETITMKSKSVKVDTQTHEVKAKSSSLNAQTWSINATTTTMNTGTWNMTGGTMNLSGGSLAVGTNSTFTGTITNNGVNIGSTHKHGGVDRGGSTSDTPS